MGYNVNFTNLRDIIKVKLLAKKYYMAKKTRDTYITSVY